LDPRRALPGVDQRDARAVDAGDRLHRELRHIAEQIDHLLRAGHDPGHPAQPGIQFGLVRLALRRGQVGRCATGLGVVVGHRGHQIYSVPHSDEVS
jgi:hypothetical protein